ncbi:MAG: hypothetical protein WDW36_005558 [Sanguina aurantia]
MKLDVNVLRYLSKDDFRVLTAVEMGQRNHEIVPIQLVDTISGLKHGGAFKCLKTLLRHKLVHHDGQHYDGYRLTYMGYDFLAIKTMCNRGHICGVGRQIGVGKESDIYEVMNEEGEVFALKLHRLGRTSFRAVKNKRDYLGKKKAFSWLYLSRLSALKEYAFMKALGEHDFPVPQAIDSNRHAVLMTLLQASQLVQRRQLNNPARVYLTCMELISRLAGKGLIHCDFNEFNLLIDNETEEVTLIDFPQMVSTAHENGKELFERDVECIVRFFTKKLGYMPTHDRSLPYVRPIFEDAIATAEPGGLDVELAASGFQSKHQQALNDFAAELAEHGSDSEIDEADAAQGDIAEEGEEVEGCDQEDEGTAAGGGSSSSQTQASPAVESAEAAAAGGSSGRGDDEGTANGSGGRKQQTEPSERFGAGMVNVAADSDSEAGEEASDSGEEEYDEYDDTRSEVSEAPSLAQTCASMLAGGRLPSNRTATPAERQVQALLVLQRKKEQKRAAMVKASHNCQSKMMRGRKSKANNNPLACGAAGDFGGW